MEDRIHRFISAASHELRTPISVIAANAELLERGIADASDEVALAVKEIRAGATRLQHVVEDLLLVARLNEAPLCFVDRVDLTSLVNAAVNAANDVAPGWEIRLLPAGVVEVLGDQSQLRQAIDRLVSNVRVHTPPDTVCDVRVAQDGPTALVSVSDHGPGLREDHARRVFDCFYRTDPSRSREHGGAGLGLSVVAAIARAHNGNVAVSCGSDGGATFTLCLPLAPAVPARA